jgi:hypothetical protein
MIACIVNAIVILAVVQQNIVKNVDVTILVKVYLKKLCFPSCMDNAFLI